MKSELLKMFSKKNGHFLWLHHHMVMVNLILHGTIRNEAQSGFICLCNNLLSLQEGINQCNVIYVRNGKY